VGKLQIKLSNNRANNLNLKQMPELLRSDHVCILDAIFSHFIGGWTWTSQRWGICSVL